VVYEMSGGAAEPHTLLGRPAACRACHSPAGAAALLGSGSPPPGPAFEDPVALRMIEKGAREWLPEGLK